VMLLELRDEFDNPGRDPEVLGKELQQLDKELAVIRTQLGKQEGDREGISRRLEKIHEEMNRKEGPKVIELRENIEKTAKQKKELEREVNKIKAMVDGTKEKVDKIEK
jgi:chromosome segregation ATPase